MNNWASNESDKDQNNKLKHEMDLQCNITYYAINYICKNKLQKENEMKNKLLNKNNVKEDQN